MEKIAAAAVRANARLVEGLAGDRLELGVLGHLAKFVDAMSELTLVHEATLASFSETLAHFRLVSSSVELGPVERSWSGQGSTTVAHHIQHMLK